MKTLGLEMSTARGSIFLGEDGEPLFEATFAADRKHSGVFFENLKHCRQSYGRPAQIVVGLGPGSYAGVRIAIATALGLQAATAARLCGIPSLCALDVDADAYAVVGDARRQSFYFARIANRRLIEGPILMSAQGLETRIKESTLPVYASEELPQFPSVKLAYPSASRLAPLADEFDDAQSLEPIYLREPHITTPRQK
jgi:tRNA threonylcarbamoyladenosine biosynthesis protein TsaB